MEKNISHSIEQEAGTVLYRRLNDEIQFLVIHRNKQGDWTLPKGHVEESETLEECALRELSEETGWSGRVIGSVGEINYQYSEKDTNLIRRVNVQYFLVEPIIEDSSLINKEEVQETRWLSNKSDWSSELTYNTDIEIIQKALKLINDIHK